MLCPGETPPFSILNKVAYMITNANERGECVIGVYTEHRWEILVLFMGHFSFV
jgi:hypothetical protein